ITGRGRVCLPEHIRQTIFGRANPAPTVTHLEPGQKLQSNYPMVHRRGGLNPPETSGHDLGSNT
ncbi:hypothetical protein, partial [Phocaeicola sp.]